MKQHYATQLLSAAALALSLTSAGSAYAQWGSDGVYGLLPSPEGVEVYAHEMSLGPDGTLWYYTYRPTSADEADYATTTYQIRLQAITKDGERLFGTDGMLISDYENWSWTQVDQMICANSDGTCTIAVSDCRNSNYFAGPLTFTAYRVRQDGTHVWDEFGVNLDDAMVVDNAMCMNVKELPDGSNLFSWCHSYGATYAIETQRVSAEGELMYNLADTQMAGTNRYYMYPYLVDGEGDGSTYLVYAFKSSLDLYVHKFNADGTSGWDSDVRVYRGGWGEITALQVRMTTLQAPGGGAFIAWNDDRAYTNSYSPFLSWIKSDGSSAYTSADGNPETRVTYSDFSCERPALAADPNGEDCYVLLSEYDNASQQWTQLTVQKVNKDGELMWGDTGVQVFPLAYRGLSFISCQMGAPGELACFWQVYNEYYDVQNYMAIISTDDAHYIMEPRLLTTTTRGRSSLKSIAVPEEGCWYVEWRDYGVLDASQDSYCLSRINFDGTVVGESDGIKPVLNAEHSSDAVYNLQGQALREQPAAGVYVQGGKVRIAK